MLQPRPLAVLEYLALRAGVVVPRDELIRALWPGTHVTKAVLKVAVRAIREALGDDANAPCYVETVGREGYRFIGNRASSTEYAWDAAVRKKRASAELIVGRTDDLATLDLGLRRVLAGERSVFFVAGEAGIGKTTLIEHFTRCVVRRSSVRVAFGQCLEHYGEGEAYLPFLEAIGGLADGDDASTVRQVLQRHAPSWESLLPAVEGGSPVARQEGSTSTSTRMLREMADALEALTRRDPLLLVLEDLQWSDHSTVDLIGWIARRRAAARLMIVASVRPVDVIVHQHPIGALRTELRARDLCHDIVLEALSLDQVSAYLEARLRVDGGVAVRALATRIYERTEGNPLFVVNVLEDFVRRGVLVPRDGAWHVGGSFEEAAQHVPGGLRGLIERRMAGLSSAAQRTLEVASVVGDDFPVAAVAAGLSEPVELVEDTCEALAAQEMVIVDAGLAQWPDGTLTGRYRFAHALYRQVLYDGVSEARRARLHRIVGARLEAALGERADDHAAELAMHFERGRDHARALRHREVAATAALHRSAQREAVAHLRAALDDLAHEPEDPARVQRELGIVVQMATSLMAVRGYADAETERAFARARSLCAALPPSAKLYPVLRGLVSYHHVRAELAAAHELGAALLELAATDRSDLTLATQAHYGQGATLFHMGALDQARLQLEAALAGYDPGSHLDHVHAYGGYDPGVASSLWLAWTLGLLGRLDEAEARSRDGLALALELGDPFSLAWAHHAIAISHQLFGDWPTSESASAEAARLAEEHGFPHVRGMALANQGWAVIMQGRFADGIPLLRNGVELVEATGAALVRPQYLGMLAVADAAHGDGALAERRFDDALDLVERTGERVHEVGLLLGKSHLLISTGQGARARGEVAESCLGRALEIARVQGARLLELRVAVALARHLSTRGRAVEGRSLLAAAHAGFADARPVVPEIPAARRLLAKLEGAAG